METLMSRDTNLWKLGFDWSHYSPVWIINYEVCCVCVCSATQSCPSLCDHIDSDPPGSSILEILQARTLGQVAISYSRGSSQPSDSTHISSTSCIDRRALYHSRHLGSPWTLLKAHENRLKCLRLQLWVEVSTSLI